MNAWIHFQSTNMTQEDSNGAKKVILPFPSLDHMADETMPLFEETNTMDVNQKAYNTDLSYVQGFREELHRVSVWLGILTGVSAIFTIVFGIFFWKFKNVTNEDEDESEPTRFGNDTNENLI